jgi:hypothetical protein
MGAGGSLLNALRVRCTVRRAHVPPGIGLASRRPFQRQACRQVLQQVQPPVGEVAAIE